jgi:hypothetical protein
VFDAVGVRVDEIPVTPEKILKALANKAAGKPARYGPGDFPAVPWPETLMVTPPWEGGDGRAANDPKRKQRKAEAGTEVKAGIAIARDQASRPDDEGSRSRGPSGPREQSERSRGPLGPGEPREGR